MESLLSLRRRLVHRTSFYALCHGEDDDYDDNNNEKGGRQRHSATVLFSEQGLALALPAPIVMVIKDFSLFLLFYLDISQCP